MPKLTILGISGSLKPGSSNTTILHYLSTLATGDMEFKIFDRLNQLPHFNPQQEAGNEAVQDLRQQLKRADALVISTPEYAFGVPGVLKNALDWLVSSGEINEKPVVAISASPLYSGGNKALASLLLTVRDALGAKMSDNSSMSIPDIANKIRNGELTDPLTREKLASIFEHLKEMI